LRKSSNQAKLIYGDNINAKDPLFGNYLVRVDEERTSEILKLDKNDVLIVTKPHLMRGLDYRSTEDGGIALFITKKFPSKRTFKQALGRVGRFDEPCKRYMVKSLGDGVDLTKRIEYMGQLSLTAGAALRVKREEKAKRKRDKIKANNLAKKQQAQATK
jgi:hypothetical protein